MSAMSPEMRAAVDAAESRHPGLSNVVSRCLVGWPVGTFPNDRVVYAGLVVKLAEWLDDGPTDELRVLANDMGVLLGQIKANERNLPWPVILEIDGMLNRL